MATSTSRPCCGDNTCIRTEIATLLGPDSSIVDRILLGACILARTCRCLSPNDLRNCASKLFGLSPECELSSAFVSAYQNERDAIAGHRQIEKHRARCTAVPLAAR
jgi:hypothetical protein